MTANYQIGHSMINMMSELRLLIQWQAYNHLLSTQLISDCTFNHIYTNAARIGCMQCVFADIILQSNVQIQFKNLLHKIHEFYTKLK